MPFKSEAQRRKIKQLVEQGKLPQSVFDAWEEDTGAGTLPERAQAKPKRQAGIKQAKPAAKQNKRW
jgi:hypothetical protein